ncbi:MAG: iron-sulfur cluster insertion protein ErpA [Chloroflexi bacterium]|nr:iron-sulfur cluster insertion protein ErpA [Chloroflexota bacterium]
MAEVTEAKTQVETQQPQTEAETPILTVTPAASAKISDLLSERAPEGGMALRVFIQGGGCSGLSYGMAFEDTIYPQDNMVETDGVTLVIDPTSLIYLRGAEIDFVDSLMGGGFAINNPNAVSSCGCGHSFRTEEGADPHGAAGGGCSSCG